MTQYTEQLSKKICEVSLEDDNYTEKLMSIMKSFRSLGEALDGFIVNKGYDGDINDIDKKVDFIKRKFKEAKIDSFPRDFKKYFTDGVKVKKKEIMYQLCFAFELDIEESKEFFRTVLLKRGFDCHYIDEAIYYYAIANHLSYSEAEELIKRAPKDDKGTIDFSGEILFTETIIKEIDRFKTKDELIKFFEENIAQFGYNNATAYSYIMDIWNRIAKNNGLADKERILNFPSIFGSKEENKRRSVWDIYLQILGLYDYDRFDENKPVFALQTNRSLKPILKNNELLHPLAEDSFPDRQGLEDILRGEHKTNEVVRKTIILLVFYMYQVNIFIKQKGKSYQVGKEDASRCFLEINSFLVDAGYPTLYEGNPYDWIFLYAMQDEYPLETFRYFMRELYIVKEDELNTRTKNK